MALAVKVQLKNLEAKKYDSEKMRLLGSVPKKSPYLIVIET
jgi:hypothetical protein